MNDVFLLLGSNLGDRRNYLREAINYIEGGVGKVARMSSIYETRSWGKVEGPDYLNQVLRINTGLTARQVLDKILGIELKMGRVRDEKWGSRIIDIDILFFNSDIMNGPGLQIPHPQLHNRRFTLEPLNEIAPSFIHPVLKKSISQLKKELRDSLLVKKL